MASSPGKPADNPDRDFGVPESAELNEVAVAEVTRDRVSATLQPLQSVAAHYHYAPYPDTVERVNLGINWDSAKGNESSEGVSHRDSPAAEFFEKPMYQDEIQCNQPQPLSLVGKKSTRKDKATGELSENFIFTLTNPNAAEDDYTHREVGNLAFQKKDHADHTEWDMNDRIVAEAYRKQGVASKMLGMMERIIKEVGKKADKPQVMTAEVGQANVLFWLLKQGFLPAGEEDQKRVEKLISGDESLTIASAPDDEQEEEKRQWFIFEKSTLLDKNGRQKPEIWSHKNYGKPEHYMKSSLRIRLKKKIR